MKRILYILLLIPIFANAQIGNISNGESGFSVRGKLNQTIDTTNKYNEDFRFIVRKEIVKELEENGIGSTKIRNSQKVHQHCP